MVSTSGPSSTASTSTVTSPEERRPQAGPLPSKRGEIGYTESQDVPVEESSNTSQVNLPARHPADRDNTTPAESGNTNDDTHSSTIPTVQISTTTDPSSTDSSTPRSDKDVNGKKIIFGGIQLSTFLAFVLQMSMLGATTAAWVVSTVILDKKKNDNNNGAAQAGISSNIFIHIVFTIATLGQLLFLERRVYRIRAERYAFLHPGEILPTSRRRGGGIDPSIGLSPWNRPPLPTYAAALAQSGVGTGDVEDHLIAQPPPPAYGNTRGSTLLLSGFLSNSLRAQRPRSGESQTQSERPKSYQSTDEEWEIVQDAVRAQRLEETLSRLERPRTRT